MKTMRVRVIQSNGRLVVPEEHARPLDMAELVGRYPFVIRPHILVGGHPDSGVRLVHNHFDFYEALRSSIIASEDNCVVLEFDD